MRPTRAESGAEALHAVRAAKGRGDPFRLVLLDAHMPGMDGFTVAQQLKSDPGPAVMMLTSSGESLDSTRCRALGISTYLVKPVRQAALIQAILAALSPIPAVEAEQTVPAEKPDHAPLNVLLAEDNVVNQRVARALLENAGHHVTIAENGRLAMAALGGAAFDLVLMDMQMPEMGGAEAIEAIRAGELARGGTEHLPVISLTAHALKGDRERCLAIGADGYVSKPIAPPILFAEIERVVPHASSPTPAVAVPSPVGKGLLARVGGSQAVLEEVIGLFLEDCPKLIDAIRAGIAKDDGAAVYRAAHTLKGTVGNFDASDAMTIAQRLEARAREGDFAACRTIFPGLEVAINTLLASLAAMTGKGEALPCAS
jgi:CheY-like chemotaxis protein